MRVLGIETSCDETSAAVVEKTAGGQPQICSNVIHSQIEEHAEFGGVVPEIASRAHLSILDEIITRALNKSKFKLSDMDAIAVTTGPGLIGGLMSGLMTAKALSASSRIPFYAINHLEGHALTPRLTDNIKFPYLLLLVSGGHTQFLEIKGIDDYHRLATTIDDALGEAFDKTAKLLSLGYPGGPEVEKQAVKGDAKRISFPRPLSGKKELNFSFSGLKTAVRQQAQRLAPLNERDTADICASFQAAIIDILTDRTKKMMDLFESGHGRSGEVKMSHNLVVAGGVAANEAIRNQLEEVCRAKGWNLIAPPLELCTDNAAMIAWAGLERLGKFPPSKLDVSPRSRWPLDKTSTTLVGSGRRGAKA